MGGKIIPRIRLTSAKDLVEVEAELGKNIYLCTEIQNIFFLLQLRSNEDSVSLLVILCVLRTNKICFVFLNLPLKGRIQNKKCHNNLDFFEFGKNLKLGEV